MSVQKIYAIVLGVVLLILGVWGFVKAPILGLFGVNVVQNIVHLVGGALGVWLQSKGFNLWLGWIALVLGILGFIPGISGVLVQILGINPAINVLHVIVGVVSLGVAYGVKD